MTILVTGGCGFIGTNFVKHILSLKGEDVVNIDSLSYASNRFLAEDRKNYTFYRKNITDKYAVESILRTHKPHAVVNFAAESHVDNSIKDSSPFVNTNVLGTVNLLECVKNVNPNIRFIHVSTDEVYGSLNIGDPGFTETTPYDPRSPYSASKAASDHFVSAYHHTHGMNTIITNCSNNYGPYQYPEKFIPVIISRALRNEKIPVYGNGMNIRDWLYVQDHCEAIFNVLWHGKSGEKYNIGGNNEYNNLTIVRKILDILAKPDSLIEFVEDRKGHDFRYSIDNTKIKRELYWIPKVDFDHGLSKTVDWYCDNRDWLYGVINNDKNNGDNFSSRKI